MKNDVMLAQVERFITFLRRLDENEVNLLGQGALKIVFSKESIEKPKREFIRNYRDFVSLLMSCNTREECNNFFFEEHLNKSDLEGILQFLGVSYTKRDTKLTLQTRIIENTIGKKLRSEAIINKD